MANHTNHLQSPFVHFHWPKKVPGEVGYDLSAVLVDDGPMPKDAFQRLWQSAPADKKAMADVLLEFRWQ